MPTRPKSAAQQQQRSGERNASNEMVSRRRILSRSRDDLNLEAAYQEEEDDVWYKKEKLYSDHIREVLSKWDSIDDEIWAKIIVFERNRRVAKAYARVGVLTIHGSDVGFDGSKIGLCGFDNPLRDPKIDEVKRYIGAGVKVKMDNEGNLMVKRLAKSNVYVRYATGENAVGSDILKLPQAALEANKGLALFDLKKFHQNVNRELKRQYPDRTRLETQCMTSLAFVKNDDDLLNCPCWVLIINIVALDMLKGKLMPTSIPPTVANPAAVQLQNGARTRIPIPDEDPYSLAGSGGGSGGSSGSSGKPSRERPPKLPPRDTNSRNGGREADYTDDTDDMEQPPAQNGGGVSGLRARLQSSRSKNKKERKKGDELYYGGFQARIPNFAKSKHPREDPRDPRAFLPPPHGVPVPHPHPAMWHSRSYESGMGRMQYVSMPNIHRMSQLQNPMNFVQPMALHQDDPYFRGLRVRVPSFRGELTSDHEPTYGVTRRPDPRRLSWSRGDSDSEPAESRPTRRSSRHRSRRRSQSREAPRVFSPTPREVVPRGRPPSRPAPRPASRPASRPPTGRIGSPQRRDVQGPAALPPPSPSRGRPAPERALSPRRGRDHSVPAPQERVLGHERALAVHRTTSLPVAKDGTGGTRVGGRPSSPAKAERFVEAMREKFEGARLTRKKNKEASNDSKPTTKGRN